MPVDAIFNGNAKLELPGPTHSSPGAPARACLSASIIYYVPRYLFKYSVSFHGELFRVWLHQYARV